MNNNREKTIKTKIPIYGMTLWVCVADDVEKARKKKNCRFGDGGELNGVIGLCSRRGRDYGLFFTRKHITAGIVAHEVFHLTHRIVESVGATFDGHPEVEQTALLNEWLTAVVHRALITAGEGKALARSLGKEF